MLGQWNRVKALPGWAPPAVPAMLGVSDFPIKVADLGPPVGAMPIGAFADVGAAAPETPPLPPVLMRRARTDLDPEHAKKSLADLGSIEGLLCCAVVDSVNGHVIARERRDEEEVDIDRAAAACAQVLRSHRLAARSMGLPDHIEEVTVSTATRHQLMRPLSRHTELFLFVLLNKQRSNLSLARFKLMEVEKALV